MENKAKIRINLDTREFEIEGTEEFVNSHTDKIEGFFGTVKQIASGKSSAKAGKASSKRGRKPNAKAAVKPAAAKEVKAAAAPVAKAKAGKRGRPAKAAAKPAAAKEVKAAAPVAKPKAGKRGRPAKAAAKPAAAKEVKTATKPAKAPKAKAAKAPKVKAVKAPKAPKAPKAKKAASAPKVEVKVTPEFIAFFKRVPKDAKDIDKMLAASLFVQNASGGTQFTAKEVNALLVSQGVKLSNAAQYVKNSIKTNRMAQLDRGKFKLTPEGVAHVNSVLTK